MRVDKQLKKSGIKYQYEAVKIPYIIASHYIPDFILDTPTGKVYIECKGYFRPEDKRKLIAVRKCNPNLDIRLLFYAERKQYIKWCTKHQFKYAIDTIPTDWLKGM